MDWAIDPLKTYLKQSFRYRIKDKESDDLEEGEEYWRSDSHVRIQSFHRVTI